MVYGSYLGAISTEKQQWNGAGDGTGGAPTLRNAHGLYYQWGRPTPFRKFDSNTSTQDANPANVPGNLLLAVQSHVFIQSSNGSDGPVKGNSLTEDWYSNTFQQWGTRWSDGTTNNIGNKTAFDPCPVGWRMPAWKDNISPWNCLNNSVGSNFTDYKGYDFTDLGRVIGYYPAAGYRVRSSGFLYDVGNLGVIWTATPSASGATNEGGRRMFFSATQIIPESNHRMANGLSVRCVQDN